MSLSRRGVALAWRLRSLHPGFGSTAAAELANAASLVGFSPDDDRHHHQQQYQPWNPSPYAQSSFSRNYSSLPGGNDEFPDATAAAAADAASTGASSLFSPESIVAMTSVAEAAALDAAGEGAWWPTRCLQWLLETVHNSTGLPWWSSIMLTTLGIRAATFPVMLMQIKNTHRLSQARPEVEALVAHMKEEQARGNPEAVSQYQARVKQVWEKYDANPLKSVGTLLVQAPLFIGFFSALRGLAAAKVPSLAEGGALWFTDLTVPDATYGLPILAGATFLLTVELGAADGMEGQPDNMKKNLKNVMRVLALVIVPFSGDLPASVFMYWTASNFVSLLQTSLLKFPAVKAALGLPKPMAGAGAGLDLSKPMVTYSHKPTAAAAAASVAAAAAAAAASASATAPAAATATPKTGRKTGVRHQAGGRRKKR